MRMTISSYGSSYVLSPTNNKDIIDLSSDVYNSHSYNMDYFLSTPHDENLLLENFFDNPNSDIVLENPNMTTSAFTMNTMPFYEMNMTEVPIYNMVLPKIQMYYMIMPEIPMPMYSMMTPPPTNIAPPPAPKKPGDGDKFSEFYPEKLSSSVALQQQIDAAVAAGQTEIRVDGIISIGAGETVDGKGIKIITPEGNVNPIFEITDGTLKNVTLVGENGSRAGDGIHTFGETATIDNVHFENVGDDAITVKTSKKVDITNSSFNNTKDKTIKVNTASNITIDNVTSTNGGEISNFLRIIGGKQYPGGTVTVSNSDIDNQEGIIGVEKSGQGYTIIEGEGNNLNGRPWIKIHANKLPNITAVDLQKRIDEAVARGETEMFLENVIQINNETLDGRGMTLITSKKFGEEDAEVQASIIKIVNGTLKNIRFKGEEGTGGAADGMYVFGDQVNIDNVHFDDVGDSAITSKEVKNLNITNSSFSGAEGDILKLNSITNLTVNNIVSYGNEANSTFVRVNPGKTYAGSSITIANSNIDNAKGVIGIDANGQGVTIANSENSNNINGNVWKMIYPSPSSPTPEISSANTINPMTTNVLSPPAISLLEISPLPTIESI